MLHYQSSCSYKIHMVGHYLFKRGCQKKHRSTFKVFILIHYYSSIMYTCIYTFQSGVVHVFLSTIVRISQTFQNKNNFCILFRAESVEPCYPELDSKTRILRSKMIAHFGFETMNW